MKGKRIILGLSLTLSLIGLVWFGGWAVWTHFQLWDIMTNVDYENTLFVVIALTFVIGIGLTLKKRKVPVQRQRLEDTKPLKKEAPNPVDLGPINKRLDEISKKVADIHMTMNFLKNVKEKEGEKT